MVRRDGSGDRVGRGADRTLSVSATPGPPSLASRDRAADRSASALSRFLFRLYFRSLSASAASLHGFQREDDLVDRLPWSRKTSSYGWVVTSGSREQDHRIADTVDPLLATPGRPSHDPTPSVPCHSQPIGILTRFERISSAPRWPAPGYSSMALNRGVSISAETISAVLSLSSSPGARREDVRRAR